MDEVDVAILRAMSQAKVMWWGSADPRISADGIARAIGVNRSTVRLRLKAWEACGFLRGYDAMPNPALLGLGLAGTSIRVVDVQRKQRVLEDLADVEGVFVALDHVGPWIAVTIAEADRAAFDAKAATLARIEGVEEVTPCAPFRAPRATVTPTRVDWRILRAIRDAPRSALSEVARAVEVSTRTLTRRYAALCDAGAVWLVPLLDFGAYRGAVAVRFLVVLEEGASVSAVTAGLRRELPLFIELTHPHASVPDFPFEVFDVLAHLPSVGAVEDAEITCRTIPGVADVEAIFPRLLHTYPRWLDERVDAVVGARG